MQLSSAHTAFDFSERWLPSAILLYHWRCRDYHRRQIGTNPTAREAILALRAVVSTHHTVQFAWTGATITSRAKASMRCMYWSCKLRVWVSGLPGFSRRPSHRKHTRVTRVGVLPGSYKMSNNPGSVNSTSAPPSAKLQSTTCKPNLLQAVDHPLSTPNTPIPSLGTLSPSVAQRLRGWVPRHTIPMASCQRSKIQPLKPRLRTSRFRGRMSNQAILAQRAAPKRFRGWICRDALLMTSQRSKMQPLERWMYTGRSRRSVTHQAAAASVSLTSPPRFAS